MVLHSLSKICNADISALICSVCLFDKCSNNLCLSGWNCTWSCSLAGQVSPHYAVSYTGSHVGCFQSIHTVEYLNPYTCHPVDQGWECNWENLEIKFEIFHHIWVGIQNVLLLEHLKHLHFMDTFFAFYYIISCFCGWRLFLKS